MLCGSRVGPGRNVLHLFLAFGGLIFSEGAVAQEVPASVMVRFGAFDGPGAIGAVADIALDEQGHVFVADGLAGNVVEFSVDGTFLRTLGRKGAGPGEYLAPGAIGWRSGGLWVLDVLQHRVTTVAADGSVVRTLTYSPRTLGPGATEVGGIGPFGDAFLALGLYRSELVARGLVKERPIFLIDDAGLVYDTLTQIPVAERETSLIPRSSGSPVYFTEPIKSFPIVHLSPDGRRLLIVERPAPDSPTGRIRLEVHEAGRGRILDQWISVPATRLTSEWIDSVLDPLYEGGHMSLIPRRELEDHLWRPDYHPPVSRAKIGSDGSIWIGREPTDADSLRWEVYDLNGTLQFTTMLPADLRVFWVHRSEVWGARPGELDVPQIEAYRIDL